MSKKSYQHRVEVYLNIETDFDEKGGMHFGHIVEFPGIMSQAKTEAGVRRQLIAEFRDVVTNHPQDLSKFKS